MEAFPLQPMNGSKLGVLFCFLLGLIAIGQEKPVIEPPQLIKQRTEYQRAKQRDSSPVVTKYLRDLEALKQRLGRDSNLAAGVAVEREIRKVMEEQRKATGGTVPRGKRVVVQCYIEENFKGREYRIEGPAEYVTAAAAGIPNDKLASMKIPSGYAVTVFGNDNFKGNSGRYTGEVPSVGNMLGKTTSLTITVDDSGGTPAVPAGDSPELTARRNEYEAELKRVSIPAVTAYRRNLQALKEQFTRESKFEAALAVDREIQKISQEAEPQ
jgi:hypothetical protein